MVVDQKTAGGTVAVPSELANLQERRTAQAKEVARLEKMDANKASQAGHDLSEVKQRERRHLAEIDAAIAELTKGATN